MDFPFLFGLTDERIRKHLSVENLSSRTYSKIFDMSLSFRVGL